MFNLLIEVYRYNVIITSKSWTWSLGGWVVKW